MSTGQADAWTVLRLLEWTTDYFKKRGAASPRLDAEVLLAEARGCSRIELYTAFNSEPSAEVREAYREMVRRRAEGTPVAYLVGHKEFYSVDLRVTEATLIPRPETEHVVIEALDRAKELRAADIQKTLRIADIGTGTGAIAIAIAKNLPQCKLFAIDASPPALEIARYNVQKLELDQRIDLRLGDLLAPLADEPPLDIICSNPPYVSAAEYEQLSPEVRNFEPQSALVAGPDGTEIIARLIDEAHPRLVSGGSLIIEYSPMISQAVVGLIQQHGGYEEPRLIKDLAGLQRVVSVKKR